MNALFLTSEIDRKFIHTFIQYTMYIQKIVHQDSKMKVSVIQIAITANGLDALKKKIQLISAQNIEIF